MSNNGKRSTPIAFLALVGLLWSPASGVAQTPGTVPSWEEAHSRIFSSRVKDRYVALAAAFPVELLDWRPMAETRSVREVIAHAAGVAGSRPGQLGIPGVDPPASDYAEEVSRLSTVSPQDLVRALDESMKHFTELLDSLDTEQRRAAVNLFGQEIEAAGALTVFQLDLHEHLGQLIAYARMNGIVPPWSR